MTIFFCYYLIMKKVKEVDYGMGKVVQIGMKVNPVTKEKIELIAAHYTIQTGKRHGQKDVIESLVEQEYKKIKG